MRKSINIAAAVLIIVSLSAFAYVNSRSPVCASFYIKDLAKKECVSKPACKKAEPNVFYGVDSRFLTKVTTAQLLEARSIEDIVPKEATASIVTYFAMRVSILDNVEEIKTVHGEGHILNDGQRELLKTVKVSDDIYIRSDFKKRNELTGEIEQSYLTYFISVVPETEAEFKYGTEALESYIKENSKEQALKVNEDLLKGGKIRFLVSAAGQIESTRLISSSAYIDLDKRMTELLNSVKDKWTPAKNKSGENISQEFVLSFGIIGC